MESAHHDLKQVNVYTSATRMVHGDSDPFTVYTVIVSCAWTKTWWVIRKRYSHFHALRQGLVHKVRAMAKAKSNTLADVHTLLQPLTSFPFPKKFLRLDTDAIMGHRKAAFKTITTMLMQARSAMLVMARRQANNSALVGELKDLRSTLDTFLGVPDRQVAEEEHRMATPLVGSFNSMDLLHTHDNDWCEDDGCSICLIVLKDATDKATGDRVLRMGATALLVKQGGPTQTPFTVYVLEVNSMPTNTWWILRKRFSQFRSFRSELVALHKYSRHAAQLQDLHEVLGPVVLTPFPTRSPFLVESDRTKHRRRTALKAFTVQLANLRQTALSHVTPSCQLKYLSKRLDLFLQVPPPIHVQAEGNYRRDEDWSSSPPPSHHALPTRSLDVPQCCVVCLEGQTLQDAVYLHCGHAFHNSCLFQWLTDNQSCPLCRKHASYGHLLPPPAQSN
ncbi:hypothetical protein DYB25_007208 [Aphanomyces astaci]|uniref:RING-type domain-containing protein n=1 Tax=Aphanomyces astaci TaxID=112090 RepID=A0A397AN14_APHAT|nr:hypothetical protein DYB36_004845 [Aphanomyces astaci]RHY21278.1 hypothetical protein DYB25_007208 [Aphanomyces astaci]